MEKDADDRILAIGDAWAERSLLIGNDNILKSKADISALRSAGAQTDLTRLARNFKLLCWRSLAEQVERFNLALFPFIIFCFISVVTKCIKI